MPFKEEIAAGRQRWGLLSFYQKFEHAVILMLTALIAIVVALAVWNLVLKVLLSIMSSGGFDLTRRHPRGLERLQAVVAESDRIAPFGLAAAPSPLLLAELDLLRHQHS